MGLQSEISIRLCPIASGLGDEKGDAAPRRRRAWREEVAESQAGDRKEESFRHSAALSLVDAKNAFCELVLSRIGYWFFRSSRVLNTVITR